jgi:hypothetical protein
MTTTITAADLTVTLTEAVTLNGYDQGSKNVKTISSITEVNKRILVVTTTEATILTFGAAMAGGTYVVGDVKYMRFTNLDDTNHIVLTFANENDDEAAIKVDAGNSFQVFGDNSGGMADVLDAKDGALTLSLGDMKSITADADTASCDMEIFVAST